MFKVVLFLFGVCFFVVGCVFFLDVFFVWFRLGFSVEEVFRRVIYLFSVNILNGIFMLEVGLYGGNIVVSKITYFFGFYVLVEGVREKSKYI